jgi:hypothetical protein
MSRIFRLVVALTALAALMAVPGALAKSTHRTHKHHTKAHRRVTDTHKTADKGAPNNTDEHHTGDGTPPGSGDLHPTPPAPSTPAANAGTVLSFTGGVLTITLTGGGTLTGQVPDGTPVVCRPAVSNHARTDTPPSTGTGDHHEPAPGTTTTTTTPPPPEPTTTTPPPPAPAGTVCGPSALVAGAVVHEAGLVLGPGGLRFTSIILVHA